MPNRCNNWIFLAASLVALALTLGPALGQDDEKILDEIVAKVNTRVITLTDLSRDLQLLRVSLRDEVQDPDRFEEEFQKRKKELLRNVIQNEVMTQKAEELGITANIDQEVDAAVDQMRQQAGIPSMEVMEQALQQRGTTLQEYRRNFKERMTIDWLVQQSVYSKITLLAEEIEGYYQEHPEQFTEPAEIELAEILFLKEGKNLEEVRRKAEEVAAKVTADNFEEMAKENSEGPTASKGGGIGTFKKGSLSEALDAVAFKLDVNQISPVVETDYGFQIVKVVSQKAPVVKPLEEVRPLIQRYLYQLKAQPELKTFLDELLQQSYIYIAPKYRAEYSVEGLGS